MEQFEINQIVVSGDLINWGPFSAQVVDRVMHAGAAVIRGNNEYYLLDYNTPRAPAHWREYTMLPWLYRQLAGRRQAAIAALPDTLSLRYPDAPPLRIVHGSPRSCWEPIFPSTPDAKVIDMLAGVEEPTIVAGHTHIAMNRKVGDRHIINPGSVGVPLDGQPEAGYMILEGDATGWHPIFRRIAYDREPLYAEFERLRFVEECGITAYLAIHEFRTAEIWVHPFANWRKATYPGTPPTPELLDEFFTIDRWPYTDRDYDLSCKNRKGYICSPACHSERSVESPQE